MSDEICNLYGDLVQRAGGYGISVSQAELDDEVPGEFDGPTIRVNPNFDTAEQAFYLAHSIGSIAEWSIHPNRSQHVIQVLRRAKENRSSDEVRLERAIAAYLSFENRTWEFACWLLEDTRHETFLAAFTTFGRADMEAMRLFHASGKAPVWREFFAAWYEQIYAGVRTIQQFACRPIPNFQAIRIPQQEIVQKDSQQEA